MGSDPTYGFLTLSWGMSLTSANFVSLIISYIESKTAAQKTIMDFVSKVFLALLLCSSLSISIIITCMTFLSDSGQMVAATFSWFIFALEQSVRLEVVAIIVLQLLCTKYPWLLGNTTFEKAYKVVSGIVMPALAITMITVYHYLGYNRPVWYAWLRGQVDAVPDSWNIFRVVSLLSFASLSASVFVFIRVKYPSGNSPNYIIRHDILMLFSLTTLGTSFLAPPQWFPISLNIIFLLYLILISASHSGVREYALNRPFMRPIVTFCRVRLVRRVTANENYPLFTVRC